MLRFWERHKKKVILLLATTLVTGATFYVLFNTARQQAVAIFNKHMAKQTGFNGRIEVDALYPDFKGNVYFHNLQFINNEEKLLYIPYGRIKLKVWDIVTRTLSISSIEELELNDVDLCLRFNKKMQLDLVRHDPDTDPEEKHVHKRTKEKFLNFKDKLPNTKIILNNADISADYKDRSFILNRTFCTIKVSQHHKLAIKFTCNEFGGSIVGNSCDLNGEIVLNPEQQNTVHLNLGLYEVVPKSLGLGKLETPLSITGEIKGNLASPEIDGAISMKRLDIPPTLTFKNLAGNYHYQNGVAAFKNVEATYCNGKVEADGLYNFDKRNYTIHAVGHGIELSSALKHSKLKGPANVHLNIYAVPNHDQTLIMGEIAAGPGRIAIFPFKSLTASVNNQNKRLDVRDIRMESQAGIFTTDYLTFKDKRVHFGPVFMDYGEGKTELIHEKK